MLEPPFIDLEAASWVDADTYVVRGDGRRFENWERSVASQIELRVAARYAVRVGIDAIEAQVKALAALLRQELAKATQRQRARSRRGQCGIVAFLKEGEAPGQTRDRLSAMNINVHVSRSPRAPALDLPAPRLDALVRVVAGWTPRYDPADDIAMRTVRSIVPVGRPRQRIQGAAAIKTEQLFLGQRQRQLLPKHGYSAVSMTFSSWKERVCAAGAAHVRMTRKSMVWKTQALCARVRPK